MKTTPYDERELTEQLFHYGVPALAWALVFAFFAFSGVVSPDEPRQMANVAPAVGLMANESDDLPVTAHSAPSAREPALRDAAVVAHEALDPVGAGPNTTR